MSALDMVSLSDFKRRVLELDGSRLQTTAQKRGFNVYVRPEGLEYVPESSGQPRPESWDRIASFIDRFNPTGSRLAADYQDLTYNASYLLALLARIGDQSPGAEPESRVPPNVAKPSVRRQDGPIRRPHQRVGAVSNAHVGRDFERVAQEYFLGQGIKLERDFPVELGLGETKVHRFDLGSADGNVLVECKSHRWTAGGKVPSAKMTVWNEAMYYFFLAPPSFRKCLFVLHDARPGSGESLLDYYLRTYPHLVPEGVEFFEWDEDTGELVAS